MSQETLYNKALEAIRALYEDKTVDTDEVVINLKTLASEIELLIVSIQS